MVKIHQIIQTKRTVAAVVNQESPVCPMPVGIAGKVVENVHQIIAVSVQLQQITACVDVVI